MISIQTTVLGRIQELHPGLSPAKQKVASYLIDNWREACFMSAAQLGKAVNVSESVVIRLAQELGFRGYPDLLGELRDFMSSHFTLVGRHERVSNQSDPGTLIESVLALDIANIHSLLLDNSCDSLSNAVTMLSQAKRIGVVSYGPTCSLSLYLSFNLNQSLNNCEHLTMGIGDWPNRIRQYKEGDLMVAASFPRYNRNVIDMLEIAKHRGARTLAITDSPLSPLAKLADHTLVVRTDGASFHRTLTAGMVLINMILAILANKENHRVRHSLAELDGILDTYRSDRSKKHD